MTYSDMVLSQVDWKKFVQNIVETFKIIAQEKHQRLDCIVSDTFHAVVECDRIRVGEILGNLISNAIAYTQPGGMIRVIIEDQADAVIIHVQDTGDGIPESALPHLFTKFFRVETTLVANSHGNGLGLYLSRAIVEMHNGKIWVESTVGKGSTFSFSLPKKHILE